MRKILIALALLSVAFKIQAQKYPYANVIDAFKSAKFNPAKPGSSFIIILSDCHWSTKDGGIPEQIIDEVKAMNPQPEFMLINGDLINRASLYFGHVPRGKKERDMALDEFQSLKAFLNKSGIPYKLVLGNHDTYPNEKDTGLFHQVFHGLKVYDSFDLSGIHIILLNGGTSGDIDKKQLEWLKNDIGKISKNQTVIIFVHQPAFMSVVRERGISEAIRDVFADHKGKIWLIGGHCHRNSMAVYKLPETKIIQTTIIACNPKKNKNPGYWLYCFNNGKVKARIYRELKSGFMVAKAPDLSKAKTIPFAFDKVKGRLWTSMVGKGDRQYLIKGKGSDVVTWWAYVKELIYKIPLAKCGGNASRIALLADLGKIGIKKENQVFLSVDNVKWHKQTIVDPVNQVYLFEIPEDMKKNDVLYIKIIGKNDTCYVGGIALCK